MEKPRSHDQTTEAMTIATGETSDAERSDAGDRSRSHDSIAERAYRRFEERGGQHGRDVDDWVEAERELERSPEE
jgi:hypothetical protein